MKNNYKVIISRKSKEKDIAFYTNKEYLLKLYNNILNLDIDKRFMVIDSLLVNMNNICDIKILIITQEGEKDSFWGNELTLLTPIVNESGKIVDFKYAKKE